MPGWRSRLLSIKAYAVYITVLYDVQFSDLRHVIKDFNPGFISEINTYVNNLISKDTYGFMIHICSSDAKEGISFLIKKLV